MAHRQPMTNVARIAPIVLLVLLLAASEQLALVRIFQVDEVQNVFMARLLATDHGERFFTSAPLMLLGPMTWLAGAADSSAALFGQLRLLFVALFWLNLVILVKAAGIRLRTRMGLGALLVVCCCAPLWDYGFEIRHDNFLLTLLLLAWWCARRSIDDGRFLHAAVLGALVPLMQLAAFKGFLYAVPVVAITLLMQLPRGARAVAVSAAGVSVGALTGAAFGVVVHKLAGTWDLYFDNALASVDKAVELESFTSAMTWARLGQQAPVLLGVTVVAIVVAIGGLRGSASWRAALAPTSSLPELALFLAGALVLALNPTPYPYNLVLVVPQALILCLRLAPLAAEPGRLRWAAALAVAHLVVFVAHTHRHLQMSNERQVALMSAAEALTDPRQHAVFDGSGLVPTRQPFARQWLLHGFTMGWFYDGTFPSIPSQLALGRTPVVILSYRTSWLSPEDAAYIEEHYLELAGDFLVAGARVDERPRVWECLVPGRYFVVTQKSDALIDGVAARGVVEIAAGAHDLRAAPSERASLVWLGPTLERPLPLGPGRWDRTFVNWY